MKKIFCINFIGFFLELGIVALLEQNFIYGVWFELKDIRHENFF